MTFSNTCRIRAHCSRTIPLVNSNVYLDPAGDRDVVHTVNALVEQDEWVAASLHVAQVGSRTAVAALVTVSSPSATSQVHRVGGAVHGDV